MTRDDREVSINPIQRSYLSIDDHVDILSPNDWKRKIVQRGNLHWYYLMVRIFECQICRRNEIFFVFDEE